MNENQELSQRVNKAESDSANSGTQGNSFKQEGDIGIGQMSGGKITGKVAGVFYEKCEITNHFATTAQQTPQPFTQELKIVVVSEEHKYDGSLVFFQLDFWEEEKDISRKKVLVNLTITFGEAKESFPLSGLFGSPKNANVRFGIRRGEFYLNFDKSSMPLSNREKLINLTNWKAEPSGEDKFPKWVFKPLEGQLILEGQLKNGSLGILSLLNDNCVIASFKVDINRKDIAVTFLDDVYENKKIQETKKIAFLKFIKPKLEEYLSKVELRYYDPTFNK
ncbi:hypothetical protein H6F50_21335 [Coleofasciculus sp. FACHB-712]|uniref:hypothetical protein n=1 Tax=Coleofasciculus sp. FACHB-712 TaxID=2692789 RepID=UPI001681D0E7|nr:hypothetical protein [Coleofasciculus sp. FACHB-712]MBD1944869.1 hypothetical protein [Coleofasciculus sp. FACHB-712]